MEGGAAVDARTFQTEALKIEKLLYHISYAMLRNESDCEDAVQEALAKAWAKRGRPDAAYFRPWLMRILINECHNLNRRRKRVIPMPEVEPSAPGVPPDLGLSEALSALPERLRVPLLLHHLEGFSVAEVARITHVPEGTVKSRLHQARERLRDEWEVRGE